MKVIYLSDRSFFEKYFFEFVRSNFNWSYDCNLIFLLDLITVQMTRYSEFRHCVLYFLLKFQNSTLFYISMKIKNSSELAQFYWLKFFLVLKYFIFYNCLLLISIFSRNFFCHSISLKHISILCLLHGIKKAQNGYLYIIWQNSNDYCISNLKFLFNKFIRIENGNMLTRL